MSVPLGRDPLTDKYQNHRFTVRGTKADAEKALREALVRRDHGTAVTPDRMTVSEFFDRWTRDYAEARVAPSTLRRYRQLVARLGVSLGAVRLQQLAPAQIQAAYRVLLEGDEVHRPLNPQTVLHHHRVLRTALGQAVRWRLIETNPADAATPPRPTAREMRTLAPDEIRLVVEACRDADDRRLIHLAVTTGMRLGELLGLKWADLDVERGHLQVRRTLQWLSGEGPTFRPPKTVRGRRSVAISTEGCDLLREHRKSQTERRLALGPAWEALDLVFPDDRGRPARPDYVSARFRKATRPCGLGGVRFHDLRHTAATLMLRAGVHPKVVSERLGHASVGITLDTYSHVLPDMQADAAEAVEALLRPAN